jgi:radical SAM-linked protein
MSYLEGIFARGDRRLAGVIEKAYRQGCRFDGWSEHLDYDRWNRALRGIDTGWYVERRRPFDEILPWDHIDCGIKKGYLRDECGKALDGVFTPDCRTAPCNGCGVCNGESGMRLASAAGDEQGGGIANWRKQPGERGADSGQAPEKACGYRKLRIRFAKLGDGRFLSHLELVTLFARAVKRAGIPVRFSEGFHPLPRIIFGPALPVGIESEYEYLDMEIAGVDDCPEMKGALNRALPEWIRIRETREIPLKCPALSDSIGAISFAIDVGECSGELLKRADWLQDRIDAFHRAVNRPVRVRTKKGMTELDLKQWVESLALTDGTDLTLVVKMSGSKTVRPSEILQEVFGVSDEQVHQARVKKIGVRFSRAPL